MNNTSDAATAGNGGSFDAQQAAALLDQTTQEARGEFAAGSTLLWLYRAVFVLVAFGGFWLSVRGQHPYAGPRGWSLPVCFVLVAINIAWSAWANVRAGTGVSGPVQRARRIWLGGILVVWIIAYSVTASLYHVGASHQVWGLYPASAPMMFVALVAAGTAAVLKDWTMTGITLAIAILAAAAGFGGVVGSWLIMGIGLSAVCLAAAAFQVWQRRRSLVQA